MIDNKLQIQEEFLKNNLYKDSLKSKVREKVNVIFTEWIHNCLPDICDEIVNYVLNEITIKEEKEDRDLIDYTLRFDKSYIESLIPNAVIFEGIASEEPDIFGTSRLIASGELEVLDIEFASIIPANKVQRYLTTDYSDKLSYKDYLDIVDKITKHIINYNGLKI